MKKPILFGLFLQVIWLVWAIVMQLVFEYHYGIVMMLKDIFVTLMLMLNALNLNDLFS